MKLRRILSKFEEKKILVLGDIMLDKSIWGRVSRISPEAPVPIVHVTSESFIPGGAANTVNNLNALGANVFVAGVIGDDNIGRKLTIELKDERIDTHGLIIDQQRPTTLKTRVISQNQQIVRIDKESRKGINDSITDQILDYINGVMDDIDAIIISDYGKGVITHKLLESLAYRGDDKVIVVDPNMKNFLDYNNITVFISNQQDASRALGITIINETSLRNMGHRLINRIDCDAVIITRGKEGMSLFEKNGNLTHIPAVAREVFDITGVSDTVTSTFTLALTSGADMVEATKLANYAASIVIGKVGTATVSREEIDGVLNEEENN